MSAEDRSFERTGGCVIHEGKIVTLVIDRFRFADGTEVEREIIRHKGAACLLYTSPSPRDGLLSRMPSSA